MKTISNQYSLSPQLLIGMASKFFLFSLIDKIRSLNLLINEFLPINLSSLMLFQALLYSIYKSIKKLVLY